ncbi:C-type lectin galactose-binding isoform-like [Pholidichthys leucotaenia]
MIPMKVIGVSLMLCTILSLNRAQDEWGWSNVNGTEEYSDSKVGYMDNEDRDDNDHMNNTMDKETEKEKHVKLGPCAYKRMYCRKYPWAYCPECDEYGYYLPQQCWASSGYCWCVNKKTGRKIPNTLTKPWMTPFNCDEESFCPDGWSWYNYKCYHFINAPKTWLEAQMYCQFDGANLASVHSYEDDHYVRSLTRVDHDFPETWLGGTDAVMHDYWMWADGTKFHYDNWALDDHLGDEMGCCLKMNYHYMWKWAPASCNATLPFICAKSL